MGKPFILAEWQKDEIIRPLFGAKRWDNQLGKYVRRYTEAFIMVPRGSGKSVLMAAIVLAEMLLDPEAGKRIYSAGTSEGNAKLIFDYVKGMIGNSKWLQKVLTDGVHAISIPKRNSVYKSIAAKAGNQHGLNPSLIIIDDLQEASTELYEVLKTACIKRASSVLLTICTAGWDRESICYKRYTYAKKVQEGTIEDPSLLVCIYEAEQDDDWTEEETWRKASPNLGVSVSLEKFRQQFNQAVESPGFENAFRMLQLNQWVEQAKRWLSMENWDQNNTATTRAELISKLAGRKCYAALDVAAKVDMNALVLLFPRTGGYDVLPYFWIPGADIIKREKRDNFGYGEHVKAGLIKTMPGDIIDYDQMRREVGEILAPFDVRELAVDPWNAKQLELQLQSDGLPIVEYPWRRQFISEPAKKLESHWIAGSFDFGNNPVMRWHLSNTAVKIYGDDTYFIDKAKSSGRIDGVSAVIMCLGRAMLNDDGNLDNTESWYDANDCGLEMF